MGPVDLVERRWQRREWLNTGAPQAISLTLAVLALFGLTLWWRRREEPAYLFFALGGVVWLLRNLHHFVEPPAERVAQDWFWWFTHASMLWALLCVTFFVLRFARAQPDWLTRPALGLALGLSLLTLPYGSWLAERTTLLYGAALLLSAALAGYLLRSAWREKKEFRRVELGVMGGAMAVCVILGAHDLAVHAGWAGLEDPYLMPFAALILMLGLLYAVQRRYTGRVEQALFQNSQLQQSLDVQADAIALQHKRLREAERQQALLLERQRLMADMHDGLGSSLLSALVAVEQGNMSQEKVVEVLRECVDDLRLVIDSLEPLGHDLVSLLATMRYRLGKRLQAGGLRLEWDVQDLPPLDWLEPPDALHVLRLMQEALNNVLKHAHAGRVRIVTRHQGSYVEIRVEDDGAGFDVQSVKHGRGLKSQIKRAQRLGGKLRVDSSPGLGTRLTLRLPVERKETPGVARPA